MKDNRILHLLDKPEDLEELYHEDKNLFELWLDNATANHPDSLILKVWNARLHYLPERDISKQNSNILFVIILCLMTGILVKMPEFLPIDEDWFYPRFIPLIVISSLIAYFFQKVDESRIKIGLVLGVIFCLAVLSFLPNNSRSSSVVMALIHMPLVLGSLLAIGFIGGKWSSVDSRLSYIRYLGEILIYTGIILVGGMVLTGLTLGLFSLIKLEIHEFYIEYIAVFGLVSAPVVATYLYDNVLGRESKISTLISNIFSPLFLLTVIIYLMAVLYQGKSPYLNREFLILFNGLLIVVWGITVFSISGIENTRRGSLSDKINVALVAVTLIINAFALSAIIFRLTEYGVTPNRIAVTGANILIFVHLMLILKTYIRYIKLQQNFVQLKSIISNYLPVYSLWSLFVVVALPLIFWFK